MLVLLLSAPAPFLPLLTCIRPFLMVMLLGICLVVSGDFGNRLIFRYPPLHASTPTHSTAAPATTTAAATPTTPRPLSTSTSSTTHNPAAPTPPPSSSHPSSSSPLSSAQSRLSTTSSLSSTKLLIPPLPPNDDDDPDDFPPPLPPSLLPLTSSSTSSSSLRRPPGPPGSSSSSPPPTSAVSLGPGSAGLSGATAAVPPLGDKEDVWGMPVYEFTRLFSPLSSHLSSSLFDVAVNAVRFLSFPLHLPVESKHELTMFNVVMVLNADTAFITRDAATTTSSTSPPSSSTVTSRLLDLYSTVVIQLSRALEHEQKRCAFLSYHSSLMTQLRDKLVHSLHHSPNLYPAPHSALSSLLIRHSLLAEHLFDLYRQLVRLERHFYVEERGKEGRSRRREREEDVTHVHILINRWLHLHCTLSPSAVLSPLLSSSSSHLSQQPIRPYQTLLLSSPRASLLASLPPDSSPLLAHFIVQLNPTQSFLSLSSALSLPLSSLLLLAHHLVQWGKARVIDTVQDSDTFVVSPPPPTLTPTLLSSFTSTFYSTSLPLFLASFHPPRPLSSHLAHLSHHAKQLHMQQLVWALEHGLLGQQRLLLFLAGPREKGVEAVEKGGDRGDAEGPREEWTEEEWVSHLRRYADGKQTLTEILWWERAHLTRNDLTSILTRHTDTFLLVETS